MRAFGSGEIVHGVEQNPVFGGLRQIEQIIEKDSLVGASESVGDRRLDRNTPRILVSGMRHPQHTAQHGAYRFTPLAGAKIQHQTLVPDKALGLSGVDEFFDQTALADAGLAAQQHRLTVAGAGIHQSCELAQLGVAADEYEVTRMTLVALEGAHAAYLDRAIKTPNLKFAHRVTIGLVFHRTPDLVGNQGLTGPGEIVETRRQIHRITGHRIFCMGSAAGAAGHHHAAGDANMGLHFAADRLGKAGHGLLNIECRADRAKRVVVMSGESAEHGHDRVADMLVDGPAKVFDDLVNGLEIPVQ